ncbi:hypothetical protein KVR01_010348 [Diaporthe batatas]|uniref:uncharacterized protein n=1 Tax=Diaporthe batatas TaxID=748121 RepID=UPI001D0433CC|nr:uncharacterized protein KVR01_010348 [Diaporthe batatas]KAG8159711.1 hypothetical protein KVR01_010348 [Diaporthe batatas]
MSSQHASAGHALDSISKPTADQNSVMGAETIIKPNVQAQHAATEEKTMSLGQALKLYPKAIGWSVLLSSTLIMEGYDLALLGSLYASPQFNMKYGVWNDSTGEYAVPAPWQSALSNGARAGEVIGLLVNGIASDRFGYRKTMIASLMAMIACVFTIFFAPNIQILVLGEVALLRLTSKNNPDFDPDETIAMIEHTNELEKSLKAGTTYWDCLKGVDLRRTEIVCILWVGQTLTGQNLMGYFSYFMSQAGMDTIHSFDLSLAQMALGLIGTAGSWYLMSRVGRRTIHLCGVAMLFSILLIVGCISFAGTNASLWATGAMLITFTFFYDFTVGPVTYSLISELSSTRLKAKTIVLARSLYNISNIVVNVLTNYQLSKTSWNWGARTAFFWAGTCGCVLVWVYFRLPEPRGRTYGELDLLFEHRVPARKFKSTTVDPYGQGASSVIKANFEDKE